MHVCSLTGRARLSIVQTFAVRDIFTFMPEHEFVHKDVTFNSIKLIRVALLCY